MASISDPVPLPLNLSSQTAKVHATAVVNCKNEAVVAIDGEGLFIHSIAPSRALSALSTGPELKFLCSPAAIRLDSESSVTFAVTEDKGETMLLRWVQNGVEYSSKKLPLYPKKSEVLSLHHVDDKGDFVLVNYNNTRLECVEIDSAKVHWTWNISNKSAYVSTFNTKDSSVLKDSQGYVLLVVSEQAQFYPLSTTTPPPESISSRSLNNSEEVSYTTFDIPSNTFYQLSRKTLHIFKPNQPKITFRLPSKFTQIFPLSTSHVLLTSPSTILIYDTIYGTTQSTYSLPTSSVILTTVPSHDPSTFHLLLSSEKPIVIPITIPATSTLLSILNTSETLSLKGIPPLLLSTKQNLKPKEILTSTKDLLHHLKIHANTNNPTEFDKTFKDFQKKNKLTSSKKDHQTKLTSPFIKEIMSLIFQTTPENGLQMRLYPPETMQYLLESGSFSRDTIPGTGEDKFILATMQNEGFLTRVLEMEPSPLTFRDYLVLIRNFLESKSGIGGIGLERVFEGFERNVDGFFDEGDMKSVLSTDQLYSLLGILTLNPSASSPAINPSSSSSASPSSAEVTIQYPALLTSVLDSIGLAQLFLPTTLPLPLLDSLLTTLSSETQHVSSCLTTSSTLSLVLNRQEDSLGKPPKQIDPIKESRKRKRGGVEIVAEEGGRGRRRVMWIKRDPVPAAGGGGVTSRFVATAKFLEVPGYSLDKMIV